MENQTNTEINKEAKLDQQTQHNVEATPAEKTENNEGVTATEFDPKEAKHGVDFCCGSCGG